MFEMGLAAMFLWLMGSFAYVQFIAHSGAPSVEVTFITITAMAMPVIAIIVWYICECLNHSVNKILQNPLVNTYIEKETTRKFERGNARFKQAVEQLLPERRTVFVRGGWQTIDPNSGEYTGRPSPEIKARAEAIVKMRHAASNSPFNRNVAKLSEKHKILLFCALYGISFALVVYGLRTYGVPLGHGSPYIPGWVGSIWWGATLLPVIALASIVIISCFHDWQNHRKINKMITMKDAIEREYFRMRATPLRYNRWLLTEISTGKTIAELDEQGRPVPTICT